MSWPKELKISLAKMLALTKIELDGKMLPASKIVITQNDEGLTEITLTLLAVCFDAFEVDAEFLANEVKVNVIIEPGEEGVIVNKIDLIVEDAED